LHKQNKGLNSVFAVKEIVEFPSGNTMPLWEFGFLY